MFMFLFLVSKFMYILHSKCLNEFFIDCFNFLTMESPIYSGFGLVSR